MFDDGMGYMPSAVEASDRTMAGAADRRGGGRGWNLVGDQAATWVVIGMDCRIGSFRPLRVAVLPVAD